MADEEVNINKIRFQVLEDQKDNFLAKSDIYFYILSIFLPRTLNLFTLLDTDQNRSNLVNLLSLAGRAWGIYMSRNELG